eukprot:CAMPEP_0116961896 /NCGR_PEP_ID=MMETSP0467-20121206/46884_1 /TAXON_ID=283647 /ORGANISM="Mesodinium pulex, Strain SPMC105" /LENGTH=31 /DNA_ID= /DNA_START= /DNA_END= /DNA_ORIENTATION=
MNNTNDEKNKRYLERFESEEVPEWADSKKKN